MWKIDKNTNNKDAQFIQNLHDTIYDSNISFSFEDSKISVTDNGVKDNDKIGNYREFEIITNTKSAWYSIFFYNRENGNTIAVYKEENRKNLIQLVLDKYIERQNDKIVVWHDGLITGAAGLTKELVLTNVKIYYPELIKTDTRNFEYIELGIFDTQIEKIELQRFVTNLLKYSLVREETKSLNSSYNNRFEEIIVKYKSIIAKEGIKEEAYKWQLIETYKGQPNLNSVEVAENLLKLDYKNLVYHQFYQVRKDMIHNRKEEYIEVYSMLFDEAQPIAERIEKFIQDNKQLYKSVFPETKNGNHHDERSLATILAVYNPEKYPLYKDSFYSELCKVLGLKKAKSKHKYEHYLNLVTEFKTEYLENEQGLIEQVNKLLVAEAKPFFKDLELNILAQDILYRVLDPTKNEVTFFKIVEQFFESLEDEESVLANFKKGTAESYKGKDVFVWLVDNLTCIGDSDAHYELREERGNIYIDIHFEAKPKEDIIKYQHLANALPDKIRTIDWWGYKSFRYENKVDGVIQEIKLKDVDAIDKIKEALLYFEETIADKVRAIKINNLGKSKIRMKQPLNQILYGPPGTGKTYNSINKALMIIENLTEEKLKEKYADRKSLKKRFDELLITDFENTNGQIAFTTFHQSMSYEDFIEGIKPKTIDNKVIYEIKKGVFKQICDEATKKIESKNFDVSYAKFIDEVLNKENFLLETPTHKKKFKVEINGNETAVAIPETDKGTRMSVTKEMVKDYIINGIIRDWKPYTTSIGEYIKTNYPVDVEEVDNTTKPYILIIDEINRGNVSKIFGELITLIEDSKRVGKSEALKAILPYSKETFSVPDNVYILGTMNTADRSVEAIDNALRRRFEFVEMMPDHKLFVGKSEYNYNGVNVSEILTTINNRIEVLLGRDHQIGHSFFILNRDEAGNCTETIEERVYTAFIKNIIPLLQEYFYGDYNKLGLVLGKGFVGKVSIDKPIDLFADNSVFNGNEYVGNDYNFSINNFVNDIGSVDYTEFSKAIITLLNKSYVEPTND